MSKRLTMDEVEAAWEELEAAREARNALEGRLSEMNENIDRLRGKHRDLADRYAREGTGE